MSSRHLNHQHQIPASAYAFNFNNVRRDTPPRSYPSVMDPTGISKQVDMGLWSAISTPQQTRPQPSAIHETGFSYCVPEDFPQMPAWDSSTMPLEPRPGMQQTYSVHQEYFNMSALNNNDWIQKSCEDTVDILPLEHSMPIGQAFTTDESVPILDLQFRGGLESDQMSVETPYNSRRMSGSSFTLSTTGAPSDIPSFEDFAASLSETPSFCSDFPPPSNRNSLMSSTQLSPVASPRMTPQYRSELVRTQSRGRASPSPRPTMRSAPYSVENSNRNKRWSTGSYALTPARRPSPFVYSQTPSFDAMSTRMSSRHSSPTPQDQMQLNTASYQTQQSQYIVAQNNAYNRNSMLLPSQVYHDQPHFQTPPPLLSHGLFRMLQSNADPHHLHSHYTDLSDPPDLYASLNEEQLSPPESDMKPSDPDLIPHEQELRFEGDLYTPRWVRGHGNKREGWCGVCKPGRWLVLKNSAFWYDKSFTHGISAATGRAFQEPLKTRRMDGNPDVWEGLCGKCEHWIALVSSKKKGTTWFRHAYKCHIHTKIKDTAKRRRESSHARAVQNNATPSKPKVETPMTPQTTPNQSHCGTPTPGNSMPLRKTVTSDISVGMI